MKAPALRPSQAHRRSLAWKAALDFAVSALARSTLLFAASALIANHAYAVQVPADSYAWGENIGWLNPLPLGNSGPGLNIGSANVTGYMWGENVGWVSFSCANDSSCATVNYGVTRNPGGKLSGYAWGANIGWISFSCENTNSCGTANFGVTANPVSGRLSGLAWGENVGWIRFSCDASGVCHSGSNLTPVLMLLLD